MSARDDVLAAVRNALAPGRETGTPHGSVTVGATASLVVEPPAAPERAVMLDLFAERVADYRATVTRCTAADLVATVASALDGAAVVVTPPGLDVDVPGAVVDYGLTHTELDAVDAVVTSAAVGIAETGTVVLDHGPGQGRRAITLLPDLHVCVVRESRWCPTCPTP